MEDTYLDTFPFPFLAYLETSTSNTILGLSPRSLWWLKILHLDIQSLNCLCRSLITNWKKLTDLLSLCLQFLAHLYSYINLIRFALYLHFKAYHRWFRDISNQYNNIYYVLLFYPTPFKIIFFPYSPATSFKK